MEFVDLDLESYYRVVAPRPTIIISTVNKKGEINAAPFSFTMPVSVNPPLIAVASVAKHHTYQNILETGEMVVNIPNETILKELWVTGEKFPVGINEIEKAGLTQMDCKEIKPPYIPECIAYLECKVQKTMECGDHQLVIGEVVKASVREDAIKDGLLDVKNIKPILHLGGKEFVVGDHQRNVDE